MTLWRTRKKQRSGSLKGALSLLLVMSWRVAWCSFIIGLQFRQNYECYCWCVKVWIKFLCVHCLPCVKLGVRMSPKIPRKLKASLHLLETWAPACSVLLAFQSLGAVENLCSSLNLDCRLQTLAMKKQFKQSLLSLLSESCLLSLLRPHSKTHRCQKNALLLWIRSQVEEHQWSLHCS